MELSGSQAAAFQSQGPAAGPGVVLSAPERHLGSLCRALGWGCNASTSPALDAQVPAHNPVPREDEAGGGGGSPQISLELG